MQKNYMILNGTNVGISNIELKKSELIIVDKSKKYQFVVTIFYNWQNINKIKIGDNEEIKFNEYILSENNEAALIWPTISSVKKIDENKIVFYFEFKDLKNICFMNKREKFDISIESLSIKVYINYKDVKNKIIKYIFDS